MTKAELDEVLRTCMELAEYIEDFCPRPGPYHPRVAAFLHMTDKIKFVPRGP
jgi:hypothetical protein